MATVQRLNAQLVPILGKNVQRYPIEKWHITIAFIGMLDERAREQFETKMRAVCSTREPLNISFDGRILHFERGSGRYTIALSIAPNRPMAELRDAVEHVLNETSDHTPEERPFRPHVTIAKGNEPIGEVEGLRVEKSSFIATDMLLYRSELRQTGSVFSVEASFALAA